MMKQKLKNTSSIAKEDFCISLVGPVGVGKSALLVKYITKRFIGEYDPCFEATWTKHEVVDGVDLNVHIMDTYDKERKNFEKYLKWSDALVLVYSVINKESFVGIVDYLEHLNDLILKRTSEDHQQTSIEKIPKIFLLGNKIDMERYRQVSKQEIEEVMGKYSANIKNLTHFETTSCEEHELVQSLIYKIIRETRKDRETISNVDPNKSKLSSKRSKSPKSTSNMLVRDPSLSSSNQNSVHANLSSISSSNMTNNINNSNNSSNSANNGSNNAGKRNGSKFPFFNRILNKT